MNELKQPASAKLKNFVTVKAKKTDEGTEIKFTSLKANTDASVRVKRIDNGYIVNVSEYNGKGFKESEYFSTESPVITIK